MKSNNLPSKLHQQLHVALDDNQLLHLFRVQGGPLGGSQVSCDSIEVFKPQLTCLGKLEQAGLVL